MSADRTGAETAALLRQCAAGRRAYAEVFRRDKELAKVVEMLELEADTLDSAARIADGNDGPLYALLPAHLWTDEMTNALYGEPGDSPADLTGSGHRG